MSGRQLLKSALLAASIFAASGAAVVNAAPIADRATLQSILGGSGVTENFQAFSIGVGDATVIDCAVLTSTSICSNQGPGLVQPGLAITGSDSLQWDGQGWVGAPSRELLSNGAELTVDFSDPTVAVGLDLRDFAGFGMTAMMQVYGSDDTTLLGSITGIALPSSGTPVFAGWQDGAGIGKIVMNRTGGFSSWSPIIDNLEYGAAATATPEPASAALLGVGIALAAWRRRRPLQAG